MDFDQYISHPGDEQGAEPVLLTDHLRAVSHVMQAEFPQDATTTKGAEFDTIAKVAGLTHDAAKATTWAQQHLRGMPLDCNEQYRYHGFPSALVTLYCAETYPTIESRDAVLAALAVARHHKRSAPPDPTHSKQAYTADKQHVSNKYRVVQRQLANMGQNPNAETVANDILSEATAAGMSASWTDFLEWFETESAMTTLARALDARTRGDHYYDDLLRLWSTLKYADQLAASLGTELTRHIDGPEVKPDGIWSTLRASDQTPMRPGDGSSALTPETLTQFIEDLPEASGVEGQLNSLRERARTETVANVESLVEAKNTVGLVTLPTGFGKTYAGLTAGLRACELTGGNLVYALPYTSILDQTAAEIERIFDVDVTDPAFTLHHHLSTTLSDLGAKYTDVDIGRSVGALHAESWRSPLTLTTTVQLFESLAAPTGRQATKLPALQDAVVVLDEPQAIPERWWKIVVELIRLLATQYDATVILMTATQPRLIEYGTGHLDSTSLVGESDEYVGFLEEHPRVQYTVDESVASDARPVDYGTAADRLASSSVGGNNTLAICNTRASARELYAQTADTLPEKWNTSVVDVGVVLNRAIKQIGESPDVDELRSLIRDDAAPPDNTDSAILVYLSGDIRPDDRQLLIDTLYDEDTASTPLLSSGEQVVVVSTSVVEAGVDISFDVVYRDVAPIPNVVQSGGRCNRSFEGSMGRVDVWKLAAPPERDQLPSRVIHGTRGADGLPLLYATETVLAAERERTIPEGTMVGEIVDRFYHHINKQYDPGSAKLAELLAECNMDELRQERIIEEIADYEDVIICSTAAERRAGGMGDSTVVSEATLLEKSGMHVSAQPPAQATEMEIGNSKYYIVDARSAQYDPIFGLN